MANTNAAAEKVLGSPVLVDLGDNALKIRRNLLAVSVIAIFMTVTGLTVNPDSSFLGIKFDNISDHTIKWALLLINLYLFIHFLWFAIDAILEWRLRITGMSKLWSGGFGSEEADYPADVRQSTLYTWWVEQSRNSEKLILPIEALQTQLDEIESKLSQEPSDAEVLRNNLNEVKTSNLNLLGYLKRMQDLANSSRIETSLKRFDNWYKLFQKSQNLRCITIEIGIPTLFGMASIILLLISLIQPFC